MKFSNVKSLLFYTKYKHKIGNNAIGTPEGTKNFKKLIPCFKIPIIVTPTKINPASPNVTIM